MAGLRPLSLDSVLGYRYRSGERYDARPFTVCHPLLKAAIGRSERWRSSDNNRWQKKKSGDFDINIEPSLRISTHPFFSFSHIASTQLQGLLRDFRHQNMNVP